MEKEIKNKIQIFAVDVDLTLTNETCWSKEDCLKATPNLEVIKKINDLAKRNYIIIYTARTHEMYEETVKWLNKYDVRYHAIRMGKLPCDGYIDDKNILIEEL